MTSCARFTIAKDALFRPFVVLRGLHYQHRTFVGGGYVDRSKQPILNFEKLSFL